MVLAALRDGLYNFVLALHILAAFVAFAPAAAHPLTMARTRQDGEGAMQRLASAMVTNSRTVYFPALVAVGVLGAILVLLSDDAWSFGDTWVVLGILVWFALCGVVSGLIIPGERAMAAGDPEGEKKVALGGQIATIGVIAILWLMIFKPFL